MYETAAARAVARETGDAAVGIYDLAEVVGVFALKTFEHGDTVGPRSGVAMTDRAGEFGKIDAVRNGVLFDHDIIVSEAVKFTEFDIHNG